MYYIRKFSEHWAVHNNFTGKHRVLSDNEVEQILTEFPNLKNSLKSSKTVTYFRNKIKSINDLP